MSEQNRNAAIEAASSLIAEAESAAAIEVADYQVCSFIIAAAWAAINDAALAERIGAAMERSRIAR